MSDVQTNHFINPSFEAGMYGWEKWPEGLRPGDVDVVPAPTEFPSGQNVLRLTSLPNDQRDSAQSARTAPQFRFPVVPGQVITVSADAYSVDGIAYIAVFFYDSEGVPFGDQGGQDYAARISTVSTLRASAVAPSRAATAEVVVFVFWPDPDITHTAYFGRFTTAASRYFDGDTPDELIPGSNSYYRHDWTGEPHRSASTRTLVTLANDWTRRWYESLPHAYRQADSAEQAPGMSPQPLLRYMDGIGQIAGHMRYISDTAWAGDLTNPDTTPDTALPWLAQMLGAPVSMQNLPLTQLRTYLQDMAADGRPAVGTRQAIITAARQFLTGDSQALIPPTSPSTPPHTIVMLVRSDQVPDGNLLAIEQKIRALGVIPAGHALSVRMARSTWDAWENAAGITWDDVEKNTHTWAIADSLGIELE